jgi:hypothetical protein
MFGNLIHDKIETVRAAAVRLLLCIKNTPGIKYYHVVPVDHLKARLEEEGRINPRNAVASGLTALMLNSYFPQGTSGNEQIDRSLNFLTTDPAAAAVFYANVARHLPLFAVAQLAAMLLSCLHSAVETDKKRQSRQQKQKDHKRRKVRVVQEESDTNVSDDEEEDDDDDEGFLSAADTPLMANLAETICTLWQSIEDKLEAEEKCNQFLLDNFSGTTLTDVLTHFEAKAVHCDETRDDCYRTRAAILRLAGRLPSKAVEGLVPHISSKLASLDDDDSNPSVSAHIALLCLWGMAEEVAQSLASSIESDFEGYHELLFSSPGADSKKRKSGRSRKPALVVPHLPPVVALDVLGDILRGSDPSGVAARQAILSSASASNTIEQALERGTKHAERLLAGDSVRRAMCVHARLLGMMCLTLFFLFQDYSQSVRDTDIDFILRVCEAYGRFALHKEASRQKTVAFSEQAERLLQWTTVKVVPALLGLSTEDRSVRMSIARTSNFPFNDPDLSSIAIEKSFDWPSSPIPTGPPRRRTNRNSTPIRFSTDGDRTVVSGNVVARAFSVSLMQSSCVIFSEWLAVGGAGAGDIDISAAEWCKIFEDDDDQSTLLPAFSRLAIQLCKTCEKFSLLKQLLVSCKEDEESADVILKMLSSLLASRGNQATHIQTKTLDCVLQAAHVLLDSQEDLVYKLPESFTELWSVDRGCISAAFVAILRNKQAGLALAKCLVESFASGPSAARALFYAKSLWMLCDPTFSKAAKEVVATVRQIDVNSVDSESELRDVLNELMEGIA